MCGPFERHDVTVQDKHDLDDVHEPDRQLQGGEIWMANVATGSRAVDQFGDIDDRFSTDC